MTTETRLAQVEGELADVTARLRRLEGKTSTEEGFVEPQLPKGWGGGVPRSGAPPSVPPVIRDWPSAPALAAAPRKPLGAGDFEAVFGGRVLAWVGGLAIIAGAVLFLFMAISRGWLDEEARTIIAAAVGLVALLGGVWLHERQGHTEAARALVAAAISGLFGTIVVATQVYSLISPVAGLACGAAVAAAGFAIAVRWRSSVVAALGSLGALSMPVVTGVGISGTGLAFVALALAATGAILIWQRWDWLALGAFIVSAPQLVGWVGLEGHDHIVLAIAVLAGFWLLYAGAALGYELRSRSEELPAASWLLLVGSCVAFVGPGYVLLHGSGHHTAAVLLLFVFGAVQAGLGVLAIRLRIHRELGSLLIAIAIGLGSFGLGETFHGPALVIAWSASAAALACLGSRLDPGPDPSLSNAARMMIAAVVPLGLAIGHTLIHEAPPSALLYGLPDLGAAAIALGACTAAAFAVGGLVRRIDRELGTLLIGVGIVVVALGLGEALHGSALVAAWAGGAVVLAALGSRLDATPDLTRSDAGRMLIAAGGFLALAFGQALIHEAPPTALIHGVPDLGAAMLALGACAAAGSAIAWSARSLDPVAARAAGFATAGVLVYLGSVLIVDTIGVDAAGETRQAGQAWLSAFWAVTGLGAVIAGLVRRTADVRLAGLALLGIAIAKVWTYDLAELDQLARVLSFVGLGLLLLVGAFAYQRINLTNTEEEQR